MDNFKYKKKIKTNKIYKKSTKYNFDLDQIL